MLKLCGVRISSNYHNNVLRVLLERPRDPWQRAKMRGLVARMELLQAK